MLPLEDCEKSVLVTHDPLVIEVPFGYRPPVSETSASDRQSEKEIRVHWGESSGITFKELLEVTPTRMRPVLPLTFTNEEFVLTLSHGSTAWRRRLKLDSDGPEGQYQCEIEGRDYSIVCSRCLVDMDNDFKTPQAPLPRPFTHWDCALLNTASGERYDIESKANWSLSAYDLDWDFWDQYRDGYRGHIVMSKDSWKHMRR